MPGPSDPAEFDALARLAARRWDIEVAAIDAIKVRENAVYRVTSADGWRAVLRIHRLGYHTVDALRSEFEWSDALRASGIAAPRALASRHGNLIEEVALEPGHPARCVDMLEWIEGSQLGSVEGGLSGHADTVAAAYRRIGAVTARMHNHATAWRPSSSFTRHAWDREGLVGERPWWGRFWELELLTPAQRALVDRARDRLHSDLTALGTDRTHFGLIHADLVPENVLVDGDHVAVIDFDDAGFGWHLFDIATTLYFVRGEPHYPRIVDAVVGGYRKHRSLSDEHLHHLPALLAARGLTYLGWVHLRRGEPAAEELAPMLIELAVDAATTYLDAR